MREIRFRVWDIKHNKMLEWDSFVRVWLYKIFTEENKDLVLMQYTGLKDKNGKEIYEGDIIKFINHNNGKELLREISWNEEDCCFQFGTSSGWKFQSYLKDTNGTMEVIGNIYENSDLLNERS